MAAHHVSNGNLGMSAMHRRAVSQVPSIDRVTVRPVRTANLHEVAVESDVRPPLEHKQQQQQHNKRGATQSHGAQQHLEAQMLIDTSDHHNRNNGDQNATQAISSLMDDFVASQLQPDDLNGHHHDVADMQIDQSPPAAARRQLMIYDLCQIVRDRISLDASRRASWAFHLWAGVPGNTDLANTIDVIPLLKQPQQLLQKLSGNKPGSNEAYAPATVKEYLNVLLKVLDLPAVSSVVENADIIHVKQQFLQAKARISEAKACTKAASSDQAAPAAVTASRATAAAAVGRLDSRSAAAMYARSEAAAGVRPARDDVALQREDGPQLEATDEQQGHVEPPSKKQRLLLSSNNTHQQQQQRSPVVLNTDTISRTLASEYGDSRKGKRCLSIFRTWVKVCDDLDDLRSLLPKFEELVQHLRSTDALGRQKYSHRTRREYIHAVRHLISPAAVRQQLDPQQVVTVLQQTGKALLAESKESATGTTSAPSAAAGGTEALQQVSAATAVGVAGRRPEASNACLVGNTLGSQGAITKPAAAAATAKVAAAAAPPPPKEQPHSHHDDDDHSGSSSDDDGDDGIGIQPCRGVIKEGDPENRSPLSDHPLPFLQRVSAFWTRPPASGPGQKSRSEDVVAEDREQQRAQEVRDRAAAAAAAAAANGPSLTSTLPSVRASEGSQLIPMTLRETGSPDNQKQQLQDQQQQPGPLSPSLTEIEQLLRKFTDSESAAGCNVLLQDMQKLFATDDSVTMMKRFDEYAAHMRQNCNPATAVHNCKYLLQCFTLPEVQALFGSQVAAMEFINTVVRAKNEFKSELKQQQSEAAPKTAAAGSGVVAAQASVPQQHAHSITAAVTAGSESLSIFAGSPDQPENHQAAADQPAPAAAVIVAGRPASETVPGLKPPLSAADWTTTISRQRPRRFRANRIDDSDDDDDVVLVTPPQQQQQLPRSAKRSAADPLAQYAEADIAVASLPGSKPASLTSSKLSYTLPVAAPESAMCLWQGRSVRSELAGQKAAGGFVPATVAEGRAVAATAAAQTVAAAAVAARAISAGGRPAQEPAVVQIETAISNKLSGQPSTQPAAAATVEQNETAATLTADGAHAEVSTEPAVSGSSLRADIDMMLVQLSNELSLDGVTAAGVQQQAERHDFVAYAMPDSFASVHSDVKLEAAAAVLSWLLMLPSGSCRELMIDMLRTTEGWLDKMLQCWSAEVQLTGCAVNRATAAAEQKCAQDFCDLKPSSSSSSCSVEGYLAGVCQLMLNVSGELCKAYYSEMTDDIITRTGLRDATSDLLAGTCQVLLQCPSDDVKRASYWRNCLFLCWKLLKMNSCSCSQVRERLHTTLHKHVLSADS